MVELEAKWCEDNDSCYTLHQTHKKMLFKKQNIDKNDIMSVKSMIDKDTFAI